MKSVLKAQNLLREVEAKLNKMIAEALAKHSYGEVKELAGLADGLAALVHEAPPADLPTRTARQLAQLVMESSPDDGGAGTKKPTIARKKRSTKRPSERKPRAKTVPSGYPRFERDENRLVKVGWSKKNQKAYEHRVPREVLGSFVDHLATVVDEGQVFEVESLLPAEDQNGDEIPAYQIYVTLAWLRESGAVEKKGRDGYVLRDGSLADGGVSRYWDALPIRSI